MINGKLGDKKFINKKSIKYEEENKENNQKI